MSRLSNQEVLVSQSTVNKIIIKTGIRKVFSWLFLINTSSFSRLAQKIFENSQTKSSPIFCCL